MSSSRTKNNLVMERTFKVWFLTMLPGSLVYVFMSHGFTADLSHLGNMISVFVMTLIFSSPVLLPAALAISFCRQIKEHQKNLIAWRLLFLTLLINGTVYMAVCIFVPSPAETFIFLAPFSGFSVIMMFLVNRDWFRMEHNMKES